MEEGPAIRREKPQADIWSARLFKLFVQTQAPKHQDAARAPQSDPVSLGTAGRIAVALKKRDSGVDLQPVERICQCQSAQTATDNNYAHRFSPERNGFSRHHILVLSFMRANVCRNWSVVFDCSRECCQRSLS